MASLPARRAALALPLLILFAIAVRIWRAEPFAPGAVAHDPDGYVQLARELDDGRHPWRWTLKAVEWREAYKAPLYQVALSLLTAHPRLFPLPQSGFVLHALLDGLTVWAIYLLGVSLHSARAGLIAACAYALWVPNILVTTSFWQEHLFVPLLVTGLALLARSIDRQQRVGSWIAAGLVLGLCALTRSAVAYYMPLALLGCMAGLPKTRVTIARMTGLLGGFAVATVPYVLLISSALGRFMPIEDLGAVALKDLVPRDAKVRVTQFMRDPSRSPTGLETARYLMADLAADPARFAARHFDTLRLILKPAGGAFLTELDTAGPTQAALWKIAVHAGLDAPFIAAAVLFPFGVVLSRQRMVGGLLALFVVEFLAILALTLWAGTRYRAPIEPALIVLASVVVAGGWRMPGRLALALAGGAALLTALVVGLSLKTTLDAWPNYGVGLWNPTTSSQATFVGRAGLNVPTVEPVLAFTLESDASGARAQAATVVVRIDGKPVDSVELRPNGPRRLRYAVRASGVSYLELTASASDGQPVAVRLQRDGR